VAYPQSNGRAEVAVKTAKRIIRETTSTGGSLQNDKAAFAILQYRNTPLHDINLSPAQILFHRQLRDAIPNHPHHYQLHSDWLEAAQKRGKIQQDRNQVIIYNYNKPARTLQPLTLGALVVVQGKNKKWEDQGHIVDILPYRQYRIRLVGSNHITLQNRRFIKQCTLITPPANIIPSPALPITPYGNNYSDNSNTQSLVQQQEQEVTITPEPSPHNSSEPVIQSNEPPPLQATHEPPIESNFTQVPLPQTIVEPHIEVPQPSKIPRSLRNLVSYNKKGFKE